MEGPVQLLPRGLPDVVGDFVVHPPGHVGVDGQALSVYGPQRHVPCRCRGEGEREQVVAGAVQFQRDHDLARLPRLGPRSFRTGPGTDQDDRPLGMCRDRHADVAEEVALDELQPARAEHGHGGLRRRVQQCFLRLVRHQTPDDGETRMEPLQFRLRVVHQPLRPVVLVRLGGSPGRFRRQHGPRVQQAQPDVAALGLVRGPPSGGKTLG